MIIEKARELGIAISESEEFINMTRTREAMEADEQLMANLNEYNAMQQSIMDIMSSDTDNTQAVQDMSRDIERLHDELLANEAFHAMLEAQARFQQLMKQVNRVIGLCIGAEEHNEPDSDEEEEGGLQRLLLTLHRLHPLRIKTILSLLKRGNCDAR